MDPPAHHSGPRSFADVVAGRDGSGGSSGGSGGSNGSVKLQTSPIRTGNRFNGTNGSDGTSLGSDKVLEAN